MFIKDKNLIKNFSCKLNKIKNSNLNNISNLSPQNKTHKINKLELLADCGATHTFLTLESAKQLQKMKLLDNIKICKEIKVQLADGKTISTSNTANLKIDENNTSTPAYIFMKKEIKQSLISLAEYTNNGCKIILEKDGMTIENKDGKIIMRNKKDENNRAWNVAFKEINRKTQAIIEKLPTNETTTFKAKYALKTTDNATFIKFVHASLGSPAYNTFLRAIRNNWIQIPHLTLKMAIKNNPNSQAEALGHMDLTRKNINSTKKRIRQISKEKIEDIEEEHDEYEDDQMLTKVYDLNNKNDIEILSTYHADATGKFPIVSAEGNSYILVAVFRGYIKLEFLKNKTAQEHTAAHDAILKFFTTKGFIIQRIRIDNETSQELENNLRNKNIQIEYVEPGNHRQLKAERAIRDAKNHLIAMLCTTDTKFPLKLWDKLQVMFEITINTLRSSKINKNISAYEEIHGQAYNFRSNPIYPAGTLVLVHNKPHLRESFAPHASPGYYLHPKINGYRQHVVYMIDTEGQRTSASIKSFSKKFETPAISREELLTTAISELIKVLRIIIFSHYFKIIDFMRD